MALLRCFALLVLCTALAACGTITPIEPKTDPEDATPASRPDDAAIERPAPVAAAAAQRFRDAAEAAAQVDCRRTVKANVVVLDQVIWLNRLGANLPGGMIYALADDVVSTATGASCGFDVDTPGAKTSCLPGEVKLRDDERPRPLVLRANVGDCLEITFSNLLNQATAQKRCTSPPAQTCATNAGCQNGGTCNAVIQPTTRAAGLHIQGVSWVDSASDDGSFVGSNPDSLARATAGTAPTPVVYELIAEHEGPNLIYSTADDFFTPPTGGAAGGSLQVGLFGSLNVQPSGYYFSLAYPGAVDWTPEWYRSQVTEQDLCWASADGGPDPYDAGRCVRQNPTTLPKIDYQAVYPKGHARAGLPILNVLCSAAVQAQPGANCKLDQIYHDDLTAMITGENAGSFPDAPVGTLPPSLRPGYSYPERLEPYREFTVIYHETFASVQAFPYYYGALTTLPSVGDNFGINYSVAGLGSPIVANRLGVGSLASCVDCKYEEFFLSSWTNGDPALLVDNPPSACVDAATGVVTDPCPPATVAHYPDDPSNVYHSYMSDHLKFRILHAGPDLHHLHHQHAHQWLGSPDTPHGDYLDSQSIGPGSAFTLEMVYGGSGNVNQTVGDSIFHCHFYPHFASGMWGLWRVHDVFESGTELDGDGQPKPGSRAYPDGEIAGGTPIPALVPLPTLAMAPMPAPVRLQDVCTGDKTVACSADSDCAAQNLGRCIGARVEVCTADGTSCISAVDGVGDPAAFTNPGYPFFIPGIAGSRAPHPPLDFAWACSGTGDVCDPADVAACDSGAGGTCTDKLDGGLPRNIFAAGSADFIDPSLIANGANAALAPYANTDYSKKILTAKPVALDETGTVVEKVGMSAHATRFHPSCTPDRADPNSCTGAEFILNGLPPVQGAPYADPCIEFSRAGGRPAGSLTSRYLAVDLQLDAVFNREGWHFPQQRIISLWGNAYDTLNGTKAPEPLFFRVNSYDCAEYVLANLVPNVYELDDFQVRTPTDVLGQHIHLVKFDVTSSDGSANGWNYEDGTFGPNEVIERIDAIRAENKCPPGEFDPPGSEQIKCPRPKAIPFFGPGPGNAWVGSQATVQRWYNDPLLNNDGVCSDDLSKPCRLDSDTSLCADPATAQCWANAGICSSDTTVRCDAGASQCPPGPGGAAPACIPSNDRTIRTVFTHDHFSPSTHQQAGLYAGLVAEPKGAQWLDNQTGEVMGGWDPATGENIVNPPVTSQFAGGTGEVHDGGPTSWQAVIRIPPTDPGHPYPELYEDYSFREFMLQVQDSTLMYQPFAVGANPYEGSDQGFCSYNGVCVDKTTGAASNTRCLVAPPRGTGTSSACSSSQQCLLVIDKLVACPPGDDPTELASICSEGLTGTDATSKVPQSCNLVPGVPYSSWHQGAFYEAAYKGVETITFNNSTNNFSFNYRNEPLFPRVMDPATGTLLPGAAGDLAFAMRSGGFCSTTNASCTRDSDCGGGTCDQRVNPRGNVCSGALATACTADAGCPGGAAGSCQPAGFCSDNQRLCTSGDTGLCGSGASCVSNAGTMPYPPLTAGVQPGDPFTPLLRAYAGDDVQIRTLIGAHINPHNFTIHGMDWIIEPSFVDSGWRNSQVMGISEHFELVLKVPPAFTPPAGAPATSAWADFVYQPGAAAIEQSSGNWGLIRAYDEIQPDLVALPQNPAPATGGSVCGSAPVRSFQAVALTAAQALTPTGGALVYNPIQGGSGASGTEIDDPNAILFFDVADPHLGGTGCVKPAGPGDKADWSGCTYSGEPEPMVLRAAAGECIELTLYNGLPATYGAGLGTASLPNGYPTGCLYKPGGGLAVPACGGAGNPPCCNQGTAGTSNVSTQVGVRAQLVTYDPRFSDGTNAGFNPVQTAPPGGSVTYQWYAGHVDPATGDRIAIEFGAANLLPPDQLNQYAHGMFGGLIIEPQSATADGCPSCGWKIESPTRAVVTYVDPADNTQKSFREFVVFMQDGPLVLPNPTTGNPNATVKIDAVNYKSEPTNLGGLLRYCTGCDPNDFSCTFSLDAYCTDSSGTCSAQPARATGQCIDVNGNCTACGAGQVAPGYPVTPTFTACAGEQVRFRLLHPGGINTNNVFELYGHSFSEGPNMTPAADCEGALMHSPLRASQFLGTTNLCGSRDWLVGPITTKGLFGESLNDWKGAYMGHGPTNHFNVLVDSAGGPKQVPGDYLYRSYPADHFNLGIWGYFQVDPAGGASCLPAPAPLTRVQRTAEAAGAVDAPASR